MKAGAVNLARHIENLQGFGLPVCVGINAFPTDTEDESVGDALEFIRSQNVVVEAL